MWGQTTDLSGDGVIDIADQLSFEAALAGAGPLHWVAMKTGGCPPSRNCIR